MLDNPWAKRAAQRVAARRVTLPRPVVRKAMDAIEMESERLQAIVTAFDLWELLHGKNKGPLGDFKKALETAYPGRDEYREVISDNFSELTRDMIYRGILNGSAAESLKTTGKDLRRVIGRMQRENADVHKQLEQIW